MTFYLHTQQVAHENYTKGRLEGRFDGIIEGEARGKLELQEICLMKF